MLISRQFFEWARDASATQRAAGAASLICDYLHMELTADEKAEVESLLTALLDDPSPLVRRAIAEGFAREPKAPRHILSALAADQPEIAAIILGQGLQFSPTELAEAVLNGGPDVHLAIARRSGLHALVADVLAERAGCAALVALAENHDADLHESAMLEMVARHGDSAALREALLARARLPAPVRARLADSVSAALAEYLGRTGWLAPERVTRVLRDAREKVIVAVSGEDAGARGAATALARQLRAAGQLTPALLLRSLLTGDPLLCLASLAELAQMPVTRVAEPAATPEGTGFSALYAKAGLPPPVQPVFRALLHQIGRDRAKGGRGSDAAKLAIRALAACATIPEAERGRVLTLLRKLESEAARDGARQRKQASDHA